MPRKYLLLTEEEKTDTVTQYVLAQERDHHVHTINQDRFRKILKTMPGSAEVLAEVKAMTHQERINKANSIIALPPDRMYLYRIAILAADTDDRKAEVEMQLEHSLPALPDGDAVAASISRIRGREQQK